MAMTASSVSFHCVVCYETFDPELRYPVVLPCGHTYICASCAQRVNKCMECRTSLFYPIETSPSNNASNQRGSAQPLQNRRGRNQSVYNSRGTYGDRGALSNENNAKKVQKKPRKRLPLPKNLVLLSLMESASACAEFSTEARKEEEDEEEDENATILAGIYIVTAECGTYAVGSEDGLLVVPSKSLKWDAYCNDDTMENVASLVSSDESSSCGQIDSNEERPASEDEVIIVSSKSLKENISFHDDTSSEERILSEKISYNDKINLNVKKAASEDGLMVVPSKSLKGDVFCNDDTSEDNASSGNAAATSEKTPSKYLKGDLFRNDDTSEDNASSGGGASSDKIFSWDQMNPNEKRSANGANYSVDDISFERLCEERPAELEGNCTKTCFPFKVNFGDRVQIIEVDQDGWAKIARGRGYIKVVNKSDLVKVCGPKDKACQIEGMIKALAKRWMIMTDNQHRFDRILAMLKKDLKSAVLEDDMTFTRSGASVSSDDESTAMNRINSLESIYDENLKAKKHRKQSSPMTPARPAENSSTFSSPSKPPHPGNTPPRNHSWSLGACLSRDMLRELYSGGRGGEEDVNEIIGISSRSPSRMPAAVAAATKISESLPPLSEGNAHFSPNTRRVAPDFRTGMSGHKCLQTSRLYSFTDSNRSEMRFMSVHTGIAGTKRRGVKKSGKDVNTRDSLNTIDSNDQERERQCQNVDNLSIEIHDVKPPPQIERRAVGSKPTTESLRCLKSPAPENPCQQKSPLNRVDNIQQIWEGTYNYKPRSHTPHIEEGTLEE